MLDNINRSYYKLLKYSKKYNFDFYQYFKIIIKTACISSVKVFFFYDFCRSSIRRFFGRFFGILSSNLYALKPRN